MMKKINKMSINEQLYHAIDKILGHTLPNKITHLKIELEPNTSPLITVSFIPEKLSDGPEVTEKFNVVPIKKKKLK